MVFPTPVQSDLVTKSNWPTIRQEFDEFETTSVLLHPFLKIKHGSEIKFDTETWPSKIEILEGTEPLTWHYINQQSDLKKSMSLIDFWHTSIATGELQIERAGFN